MEEGAGSICRRRGGRKRGRNEHDEGKELRRAVRKKRMERRRGRIRKSGGG